MTNEQLAEIEAMLTMLERHPVQRFATVGYTIEFQPKQAAMEMPEPGEDKRICACGHDLNTEHNQFGCLICTGEKCPGNTEDKP